MTITLKGVRHKGERHGQHGSPSAAYHQEGHKLQILIVDIGYEHEADGTDDYAQMREVISRRYTRLLTEGSELPQLLVVDGGKGQLNAAVEVLEELGLRESIAAIGIAKRLDEIFFPGDSVPLYIDKNSETIRVIQRLRDEAHRFGITHHRNRRSKAQLHSQLDDIKGVGPQTRNMLLKHFKSVKRIKEATLEEVVAVVGEKKARLVVEALQQ